VVAFDLESNSFFGYPERVCLVQIGIPGQTYIIDPINLEGINPLGDLLRDDSITKVLHAGDYDVRSLDRDWGFRICNLFDTHIAAAFIGLKRLGLAAVLQDVMDITITKEKSIQRQDWARRPLNTESLNYATGDVLYLIELQDVLASKISELGRTSWVNEEFTRQSNIKYSPPDLENAVFRVKGSRELDGQGLAVLKRLLHYRDQKARAADLPPFKVIPDSTLLTISSTTEADLRKVKGLGRFGRQPLLTELKEAINEGLTALPLTRPNRPNAPRLTAAQRTESRERLKILKTWRAGLGYQLQLDPALLWPAVSLERIARNLSSLEDEMESPEVRGWQAAEFGESLGEQVTLMQ